jgi:hypothetical protein
MCQYLILRYYVRLYGFPESDGVGFSVYGLYNLYSKYPRGVLQIVRLLPQGFLTTFVSVQRAGEAFLCFLRGDKLYNIATPVSKIV